MGAGIRHICQRLRANNNSFVLLWQRFSFLYMCSEHVFWHYPHVWKGQDLQHDSTFIILMKALEPLEDTVESPALCKFTYKNEVYVYNRIHRADFLQSSIYGLPWSKILILADADLYDSLLCIMVLLLSIDICWSKSLLTTLYENWINMMLI